MAALIIQKVKVFEITNESDFVQKFDTECDITCNDNAWGVHIQIQSNSEFCFIDEEFHPRPRSPGWPALTPPTIHFEISIPSASSTPVTAASGQSIETPPLLQFIVKPDTDTARLGDKAQILTLPDDNLCIKFQNINGKSLKSSLFRKYY